jgi:hypothetical protein
MVLNVVVAVFLALVTILTAYLGLHVTLHPTEQPRVKVKYKAGFWVCGIVALILNVIQTVRSTNTQSHLEALLSHTHIRMAIGNLVVTDPNQVGKHSTLRDALLLNRKASFNVVYQNVGTIETKHTGGTGTILVESKVTQSEINAAFSRLDASFTKDWKGDELVPQEPKFFTVESRTVSPGDVAGIEAGTSILLVLGIVKFSDLSGDYQQELCQWLQPPGNSSVWHGCGMHESEKLVQAKSR